MTFLELKQKFQTRWWWLIISILAFALAFFPFVNQENYVAEITVGLNLNSLNNNSNNSETPTSPVNSQAELAAVQILPEFSLYLQSRFNSLSIQQQLAKNIGEDERNLDPGEPFYEMKNENLGFVTLRYRNKDKIIAEKFLQAVPIIYSQNILSEWNESRTPQFQIQPMRKFNQSLTVAKQPKQMQILPLFAGFSLGLVLLILVPKKVR